MPLNRTQSIPYKVFQALANLSRRSPDYIDLIIDTKKSCAAERPLTFMDLQDERSWLQKKLVDISERFLKIGRYQGTRREQPNLTRLNSEKLRESKEFLENRLQIFQDYGITRNADQLQTLLLKSEFAIPTPLTRALEASIALEKTLTDEITKICKEKQVESFLKSSLHMIIDRLKDADYWTSSLEQLRVKLDRSYRVVIKEFKTFLETITDLETVSAMIDNNS